MKAESFVYVAQVLQMTAHSSPNWSLGAWDLGKLGCDGMCQQLEVPMLNTQEPRTRFEMLSHNAQNGTMLLGTPWIYYSPLWININIKLVHSEIFYRFQNFQNPHIQLPDLKQSGEPQFRKQWVALLVVNYV